MHICKAPEEVAKILICRISWEPWLFPLKHVSLVRPSLLGIDVARQAPLLPPHTDIPSPFPLPSFLLSLSRPRNSIEPVSWPARMQINPFFPYLPSPSPYRPGRRISYYRENGPLARSLLARLPDLQIYIASAKAKGRKKNGPGNE